MTERFTTEIIESAPSDPSGAVVINWRVMEGEFEHYVVPSEITAKLLAKGLKDKADLNKYLDTKQTADEKKYMLDKELITAKSKLAIEIQEEYELQAELENSSVPNSSNEADTPAAQEKDAPIKKATKLKI
ncbi:hypothetical protein [Pseudomonas syringae]|uniref:hypothetical protein n=1 Tax=Pseudomonas syringae TaxID=317 RepID=UPI000CD34FC9|nr:hypothetical protein [Pseudomonas syringae]SOP98618.1 hypothetical protein CFBP4215_02150 [Pseudomonas syringae pv. syringae]